MNKQTARSLMMDYLYHEISKKNKEKLETYLDNNPEMLQELKELRKTQKLLKQMPEVEAPQKLRMMESESRSFAGWWQDAKNILPRSGWGKTALAAAACLLLLLVAGSVANLQISSGEAGFSLSLGYGNSEVNSNRLTTDLQQNPNLAVGQQDSTSEPIQKANYVTKKEAGRFMTQQEAETLLAKMQVQNKALLTAFAQQMNEQDQQQLQQIVKYFQAQRIYDLKRIKQSLNQTQLAQLANAYRWQQTNQILGEIIQTTSVER